MTTYKGIKGFIVQTLSSDPTTASSVGQVYYNSTGNAFKYVQPGGVASATWSSGGTMGTGRNRGYGTGTQTAALAAGGYSGAVTVNTEEYNGTSWSEQNNLPSGRGQGAAGGTQTAACLTGGQISDSTDEILLYNGTSYKSSIRNCSKYG